MNLYIPITTVLYCVVNYFLLIGTARMLRQPVGWRSIFGAVIGGIYVLLCLISRSEIICSMPLTLFSLVCMAMVTYGFNPGWIVSSTVFILLNLALGGITVGVKGLISLFLGSIGVFLVCYIAPKGVSEDLIQVELYHHGKVYSLKALRDNGNCLRDPISGQPVLILGADISEAIIGLSADQLRRPVESLGIVPGLRLIPYKTVGQSGAFMLATRLNKIKIGSWQGSAVVAFSPELLSAKGAYQALTGGYV